MPFIIIVKIVIEVIFGIIMYGVFLSLWRGISRFWTTLKCNPKNLTETLDAAGENLSDAMDEYEETDNDLTEFTRTGQITDDEGNVLGGVDAQTLNSLYEMNREDYEKKFDAKVEKVKQDKSIVDNETDKLCLNYLQLNENLERLEKQLKDLENDIPYRKNDSRFQTALESRDKYKELMSDIDKTIDDREKDKRDWILRYIVHDVFRVTITELGNIQDDDESIKELLRQQVADAAFASMGSASRGKISQMSPGI